MKPSRFAFLRMNLERRHPDGKIARAISVTLAIGDDERPSDACRQDDGVPNAH
jgi:hypothetical protein